MKITIFTGGFFVCKAAREIREEGLFLLMKTTFSC